MTVKNKFNLGDIVIDLSNVELWDNIYHFEKFNDLLRNSKTVKHIDTTFGNGGFFTTDENVDLSSYEDRTDLRKSMVIYQLKDGKNLSSFNPVYNWTTNRKGIEAFLKKKFDAALQRCDEEDAAEIEDLERQIEVLKKRIEKIKKGDREVSYQRDVNARGFVNAQIEKITNILNDLEKTAK